MHSLAQFFFGANSTLPDKLETNDQTQKNETEYNMNDYEKIRVLGCGMYGRVHLAKHNKTQEQIAIKVMRKSVLIKLKQVEHIKNEKEVLMKTDHPFVVKLYETQSDNNNIYFIMELCTGGELFALMRTLNRLRKIEAQFYAAEIVLALEYLHSIGVAYRDLKPENVILDDKGHIKICDFGFAKFVSDRTWTLCGTPEYIAPEIITGGGHDKGVDWWALGILIYEMLAGYPPFYGEHPFEIYEKICDGFFKFPVHFDDDSRDLVSKLLNPSKSRRLGNCHEGARAVKAHPFFSNIDWDSLSRREIPPPVSPQALLCAQNFMTEGSQEDDPEYDLQLNSPDNSNEDGNFGNVFDDF